MKMLKTRPGHNDFERFARLPERLYPKGSPRFLLGHDPVETHLEGCYVLCEGEEAVGRYACYENKNLRVNGEPAACIGSYECIDDDRVSKELLNHAKTWAQKKGYSWIVGPMEGSTWNNHRFSLNNDHPNFFMEPYHHSYYNQQFTNHGFTPLAHYYSNLDENLVVDDNQVHEFEKSYIEQGAVFRNLDLRDLENELYQLAAFSLNAFKSNFLFSPISEADFVSKYLKIKSLIDPNLTWIVEDQSGEIQAFIFSIPDHFETHKPSKTLIIKSMARKRSSPFKGIGSYLAIKTVQLAKKQGYERVIHAFMIKDNASRLISEKFAKKSGNFKNYVLYGLQL